MSELTMTAEQACQLFNTIGGPRLNTPQALAVWLGLEKATYLNQMAFLQSSVGPATKFFVFQETFEKRKEKAEERGKKTGKECSAVPPRDFFGGKSVEDMTGLSAKRQNRLRDEIAKQFPGILATTRGANGHLHYHVDMKMYLGLLSDPGRTKPPETPDGSFEKTDDGEEFPETPDGSFRNNPNGVSGNSRREFSTKRRLGSSHIEEVNTCTQEQKTLTGGRSSSDDLSYSPKKILGIKIFSLEEQDEFLYLKGEAANAYGLEDEDIENFAKEHLTFCGQTPCLSHFKKWYKTLK